MAYFNQIANELRRNIRNGLYKKDNQLPKQTELAEQYQTSRVTIQKALNLLQAEGLIYGKKGTGTYINPKQSVLDYNADIYHGLTKRLGQAGVISSQIISFDILLPDELEQEKLKIDKNQPIYDIVRLRLLDGVPLVIEYTAMPVAIIPNLTEDILTGSIYQYLNSLNLTIGDALRRIKADKPDTYDQKYLNCELTDPVLEIEQTVFLTDGRPFEYSHSRHRYDMGDFVVTNIGRVQQHR